MGLTSIQSIPAAAETAAGATATPAADWTRDERSFNRAVSAAVEQLNGIGFAGDNREITFSIDQSSKRVVVQVVDKSTNEVIMQWPPESVLQWAAENMKNG